MAQTDFEGSSGSACKPYVGITLASCWVMAEGHAVIRWARALAVLHNEPLESVSLPRRWGERGQTLRGERITTIETRGKHLLLHLSNGETVHTHAMQYGSWQVGLRPLDLRKAAHYVRLHLVTASFEAVFYHGPVVELLTADELANHAALNALGPDVMALNFDRDEAARRVAAANERPIGDAVLDQRIVAGLGNIFKSEGLFLASVDPRREAGSVSPAELARLWDVIIPIMWRGTERFGRTATTPVDMQDKGQLHWVYRRKGQLCFRCDGTITMARQGELERSTYYCPGCQT